MKYSTAISLALAPVALAKSVRNKFPVRRDPSSGRGGKSLNVAGAVGLNTPTVITGQTEVILIWVNQGGPQGVTQTLNQQVTVTSTVTVPAGAAPSVVNVGGGQTTVLNPGETAVIPGAAQTHTVTVGGPAGNTFFPQEIKANINDIVLFEFLATNHSVTQSTFDAPCDALAGGMDSGFMANPNNTVLPPPQVAMQVMTLEPLWMFCPQGNHCGQGMAFSINANTEKTHAQFQQNAITQRGQNLAQTGITGGSGAAAPAAAPAAPGAPPAAAPPAIDPLAPAPVADPLASPSLDAGPSIASLAVDPLATGSIANGNAALGGAVGGGIVMGQGVVQADGSCQCAVQCAAQNAFPDPAAQGINSFGGVAGTISAGNAAIAPGAIPPARR